MDGDYFNSSLNFSSSDSLDFGLSTSYLFDFSTNLAEIDPLVLDLDGDGIELTPFANQYLFFDIDNDGSQERTGWVGQDDGMLVHDLNGDGQINDITETLSEYYDADKGTGAIWDSSFAALESLDSNSDGVINASDDAFAELKVWQDSNQDGVTDEGELKTLSELDITELSLNDTTDGAFIGGNEVKSNSTYTNGNGTTQTLAAVNFIADPNGLTSEDDGTGQLIEVQDGASTYAVGDELGETVDATDKDVTNIIGGTGDDVLTGNAEDNWLVGSLGEDQLSGGAGNDYLVADAADIANTQANIQGGDGFDIVQFVGDEGVTFNLQESQVEMAVGTDQSDVLVSGSSDQSVITFADGTQWSADNIAEYASWIQGTDANDTLSGTSDIDRIEGGEGDDVLSGGYDDDAFIFADNFGADTVTDFTDGDVIEFSGNTFDSYASVLAAAVEDGDDTVIILDADTSITLNNVALADLQADDFRFA
jgi:Ca2+-binding RTX toxin-like protein